MANQNLTPRLNRNESNIVIDGGHEIWPEGVSRSVANNTSAYGAVLFKCNNASSGITLTNSQQSPVPSGTDIPFSNQVSKTAAGTLAAGTATGLEYFIEGYDTRRIYKNEFSVIFWVKSSVASNRSVALRNNGSTHSYVRQYAINATNTWELKVLRFDALNTCPGTINRTNSIGVRINFGIVSGTTFQTATLNQWQSGNFLSGTSEDTTWLTGTTHDFNIAGVMILPGDWEALTSSGYEFIRASKAFSDEISKSQRYFEKSYDLSVNPGTDTLHGTSWFIACRTTAAIAGFTNLTVPYKSRKRSASTLTIYSRTGASGNVRDESGGVDTAATINNNGESGHGVNFAITDTRYYAWHFVADARF